MSGDADRSSGRTAVRREVALRLEKAHILKRLSEGCYGGDGFRRRRRRAETDVIPDRINKVRYKHNNRLDDSDEEKEPGKGRKGRGEERRSVGAGSEGTARETSKRERDRERWRAGSKKERGSEWEIGRERGRERSERESNESE